MQAPTIGGVRVRKGDGETVRLPRGASLTDFAERIGVDAASLVQMLFSLGEMVTATESVNDATLELLGEELNYVVEVVSPEDEDRELLESFDLEFGEDEGDDSDLVVRPPVVTVMGHVDHGKTKLLDALREANVVDKEAGGITQHIGAYQVHAEVDGQDRRITFIDTPGHEAFTAMRARGSQSSDIAVLVVAADDGVMPQTVEALNHAKAAGVPIVVAVNKIDKPDADPAKVRGQLTEYGLVPEEYGGDAMFVDVSAKSGTNLEQLLEAIVLTADASLDLRANPTQDAQGLVVEAHLDRGRGPVATVLIQRGTLRVGDSIVAGPAHGRVRAMLDEHGENIEEATPSRPAMVLGLTAVPGAGQNLIVVDDDRMARQIAEKREARERAAMQAKRRVRRTLEDFMASMEKGQSQELNLILKGDVSGSVEALEDSLSKIDVGDEVNLRVIDRGVGAITETNVDLAAASDAIIIGFNVRPQGKVTEMAEREGVEIRYYSVIYNAIEEIEAALKGMLKPEFEEQTLGQAEIRAIFRSSKIGNIAGCMVTSGVIRRNAKVRLIRDGDVVAGERRPVLAEAGEGRRVRGPRGLRVWSGDQGLQRHQGRRCRRGVRDEGDPAGLRPFLWDRRIPKVSRGSGASSGMHAAGGARKPRYLGNHVTPKDNHHEQPTRPQDRRPDPGDRRGDAGAPDQGSPAGVRHGDRRPGLGRHAAGVRLLHRLRRGERPRRHGGGAGVGQGTDPVRGRQAARDAARADDRVHPGRAPRERRATSTSCSPRRASRTPRSAPRPPGRRSPATTTRTASRGSRTTSPTRSEPVTTEAGLVVVDKTGGMTSHDVVARVRRLAGTRKVGHAGTLDPMATGVLVLGVNRATRLLGHLMLTEKAYDATIRLGVATTHRRRRG